jgi:hypothetical protein
MSMFFLIRVFVFAVVVAVVCCSPPGLYSHSDELIEIEARCRLGFERRVDAAIYQTVLGDQNAHAVIGTRCRRNG